MKNRNKLLLIAFLLFIFSCNDKGEKIIDSGSTHHAVSAVDYYTCDMHYKIFFSGDGGLYILNLTKDSIVCNR